MANPHWHDWPAYGSPAQADGLFLMVAPGCLADGILFRPGAQGWRPMERADIAEFCIGLPES